MPVRCPDRLPEEASRQEMAELSPIVQALPPTAALMELKGALHYHGADARRQSEVLRGRTLSRLGVDLRIGIGQSITVAATASGQMTAPGGVLAVTPDQVTDWLGPLPVDALHGIGPRHAAALHDYGVHTIGRLAALPTAPAAPPPTAPAASTPALSPAPCPPPQPCATPSLATP